LFVFNLLFLFVDKTENKKAQKYDKKKKPQCRPAARGRKSWGQGVTLWPLPE
jgi:hypothetical protein